MQNKALKKKVLSVLLTLVSICFVFKSGFGGGGGGFGRQDTESSSGGGFGGNKSGVSFWYFVCILEERENGEISPEVRG